MTSASRPLAWSKDCAPIAASPCAACAATAADASPGGLRFTDGAVCTCRTERPPAKKVNFHLPGLLGKLLPRFGGTRKNSGLEELPMPKRRSIQATRQFGRLYQLGEEVIEPSRPGTEVRHAQRRRDSMPVVVKVRRKGKSGEESAFYSAQDEAEWRASMEVVLNLPRHVHIAYVYEVLEDDYAYYVVMERAHGSDLFETLHRQKRGCLPAGDIREIVRQLLDAIVALHAEGCVHRDIKLDNAVLDRRRSGRAFEVAPPGCGALSFVVKLVDFDDAQAWPVRPQSLPAKRCVVGTDQYIAPEAYAGVYSPASDIFAAGVILYRLLTARFPFDPQMFDDSPGENYVGSPKMEEIRQRLQCAVIDFDRRPRGVPEPCPEALALCRRMLSMDPRDRPTADQVLMDPWLSPALAATWPLRTDLRATAEPLDSRERDSLAFPPSAPVPMPPFKGAVPPPSPDELLSLAAAEVSGPGQDAQGAKAELYTSGVQAQGVGNEPLSPCLSAREASAVLPNCIADDEEEEPGAKQIQELGSTIASSTGLRSSVPSSASCSGDCSAGRSDSRGSSSRGGSR